MTEAFPNQSEFSSRTLILCAILSLGLHAGLLAGLNMIPKSERPIETIPLVNVTLVQPKAPAEPTTSKELDDPVPPLMRSTPRSTKSQTIPTPTTPTVTQLREIVTASALKISPVQATKPLPTPPPKKRMLRDTRAADALFAQQTTKLVKRTTKARIPSPSTFSEPKTLITNIPTRPSLSPSVTSIHAASAPSKQHRKRRLLSQAPPASGPGVAKIGVRRSVQPVYPRVAKEEGWEGVVILKVLVRTSGLPGEITVRKSSGHTILDKAAIEAMRQWRFVPAMDGNFPIEKYLQVPLKFGLHG